MSHWKVGSEYLRQKMTTISGGAPKKKNAQEAHEAIRPTNLATVKPSVGKRCGEKSI